MLGVKGRVRQIAPSDTTSRRNFLRLWRRNHLRSRRNNDVRSRLGQPGTLVGLWLFHRCGRADHIGLGEGCRLVGLRSPRHDAGRFLLNHAESSFSITRQLRAQPFVPAKAIIKLM